MHESSIIPVISSSISNQYISCFAQDHFGYLWIGTQRGINRFNGYDFHQYFRPTAGKVSLVDNFIHTICSDAHNQLWVGTEKGISCYNIVTDGWKSIPIEGKEQPVFQIYASSEGQIFANTRSAIYKYDPAKSEFVRVIAFEKYNLSNRFYIDRQNHLWLISQHWVICYRSDNFKPVNSFYISDTANLFYANLLDNGQLWVNYGKGHLQVFNTIESKPCVVPKVISHHPVLSKAIITMVASYKKGQLLINTHKNGLFLVDTILHKVCFQNNAGFPFKVPTNEIITVFRDQKGNIWLGTHDQGFQVIRKEKNEFNVTSKISLKLRQKSVTALAKDQKGNLWLATYNDDLFLFDRNQNQKEHINLKQFFPEDPYFQDKVAQIFVSHSGAVWLMTDAKLTQCVYTRGHLIRNKTYLFNDQVCSFVEDRQGTIWISSESGRIYYINKNTQSVKELRFNHSNSKSRTILRLLFNGNILSVSANQPLRMINPVTHTVKSINLKFASGMNQFNPTTVFVDKQKIWIGSMEQNLLCYSIQSDSIQWIDNTMNVMSIVPDSIGNLWLGTLYGLKYFKSDKHRVFSFFAYDGIGGNQFNLNSICRWNNYLVVGGTHGVTILNPLKIARKQKITLRFEDLKVNNHLVNVDSGLIDSAMICGPAIHLKYDQNVLGISYAALDFSKYPRLKYYYKLKGYENQWTDAKNNRTAFYSNLPHGNYTFQVRATDKDNNQIRAENSINIVIKSAPWLNCYALIAYLLFGLALLLFLLSLYRQFRNSKVKALLAIKDKEHEEQVNKMDKSFFSNISHEFRTPLTIISGPISTLAKDSSLNDSNKKLLLLVQRNIERLLRLVNQLMDMNKLDQDVLKLEVRRTDMTAELLSILSFYQINAREKQIDLRFEGLDTSLFMLADTDKIEKIIGNLLSNALKFTPKGGTIRLAFKVITEMQARTDFGDLMLSKGEYYVQIQVIDNGPGIPEDKQEAVFQKYYQIDHSNQVTYNWGTGIGLYYVRRLLTLHHGAIRIVTPEGGGCCFSFILPMSDEAYSDCEKANKQSHSDYSGTVFKEESIYSRTSENSDPQNKETILVVDDDTDLVGYLNLILRPYFRVFNCYDAEHALNYLDDNHPDIIISDILMPGIGGYAFCQRIKQNRDLCHIPVILLSAKNQLDERVEGLNCGANAYLTKPFEPDFLIALIKTQLLNRKLLADSLSKSTSWNSENSNLVSPQDKIFMKQLYDLMDKELSNAELNITAIADIMHISRTKFYYKLKGLTDSTPSQFFKSYKLNRAAEFLKEGTYTVSEVAEKTGFSNLSYFSASFKKKFGNSPSEYRG